ncbi:sugar 3,4-ketoisomerase [Hymenobacter sediminicola]|uniref:FdtA/QdtA family cupin domain-containing protein n=1 Tax=Hymenobacter sediminicola TaxID=2761579 RepID=A0A7G7W293_9BACT|nr:FdtA/QdtA family cupin domain-containing protein [Hymenobacter sediminicola]QNH60486.1 FdtA/QdtA family cupin domain-containing protein [Hymenobacter sediminicola]
MSIVPAEALPVPRLMPLPVIGDAATGYTATAAPGALPFPIARVYWTYGTPANVLRGHHAHHTLEQLLVAVSGRLDVTLENPAGEQQQFTLERPDVGLYLPGLYWRTIRFHKQAVLLCLVSQPYSEASYIRDYAAFRALANASDTL